jgi:hypothetical protein
MGRGQWYITARLAAIILASIQRCVMGAANSM